MKEEQKLTSDQQEPKALVNLHERKKGNSLGKNMSQRHQKQKGGKQAFIVFSAPSQIHLVPTFDTQTFQQLQITNKSVLCQCAGLNSYPHQESNPRPGAFGGGMQALPAC